VCRAATLATLISYYIPYDGVARAIPGVWISGSEGARLRAFCRGGDARATLVTRATYRHITSHNVIGELPGADGESVIIGCIIMTGRGRRPSRMPRA
jgi:hypothetical protein